MLLLSANYVTISIEKVAVLIKHMCIATSNFHAFPIWTYENASRRPNLPAVLINSATERI